MTCNTFNNQTSKYSISALTISDLTSQLYSFDELYNLQVNPAIKYDQDVIYSTIALTQEALINVDPNGTTYPLVLERFKQGPVLSAEYADFLEFSQYDLEFLNSLLSSYNSTISSVGGQSNASQVTNDSQLEINSYYTQLDLYYNNNFETSLSGGFCSAFNGNLLQVAGLVSAGASLIDQLKNFSIKDVIDKLNSIKDILNKLVDSLKDRFLQQINNIVKKIESFKNMAIATANAISKKLARAKNFFSDLNIKNIKTKIESIIAQMAGGYEKITPEVIAYILFRLCKLTEIVGAFMRSPVDGLKSIVNAYVIQSALFSNFSVTATTDAVKAGHFRKDPFVIIAEKNNAAQVINNAGVGAHINKEFTTEEISMANEIRSATIEQINSNSFAASNMISFSTLNKDEAPLSWQKVEIGVWVRIFRVAKKLNTILSINSAYRSSAKQQRLYNAAIAKNGPSQKSVAKPGRSQHNFGQALDVNMAGKSDEFRNNSIRACSEEGFDGIGTYSKFIHVDTRGHISIWGNYNSLALSNHKKQSYRKGLYEGDNL